MKKGAPKAAAPPAEPVAAPAAPNIPANAVPRGKVVHKHHSKSQGSAPSASASGLRLFQDDAPGIKLGPYAVLVMSLSFIGVVILLHIWGRLTK